MPVEACGTAAIRSVFRQDRWLFEMGHWGCLTEARLLLALTMGCKKFFYVTVCCCCFASRISVRISLARRCNCICFRLNPFYDDSVLDFGYYVGFGHI